MNAVEFFLENGFNRVSSGFGYRRDPITGRLDVFHYGVDFPAPVGSPIKALEPGIITASRHVARAGNSIVIRSDITGKMLNHYHCHGLFVKLGARVLANQTIASVGSTGDSTGPHLHFEIRHDNGTPFGKRDKKLNPYFYLLEDLMFWDVKKGHWAEHDIKQVAEDGLMVGFEDGSFKPNEPVTRAQLAVIINRLRK